jgi:menaquinone-dependent protoporphyrinogen oxidase
MTAQSTLLARVLVVYATRGGATRELAEQVAQELEQVELTVDLQPVTAPADVASYRAVVLGSALYFQRLMPEALRFLTHHATLLAQRPLAIFSVGAEMRKGTPAARQAAETWVRRSLAALPSIQPVALQHFAGAVELRRLSFWWRLLVLLTFGERGDWRDIPGVRAWARALAPQIDPAAVLPAADPQRQPEHGSGEAGC